MLQHGKKIQVQLYSKGTGKPESFSFPAKVVFWWIFGFVLIVLGFIFWLPDNIVSEKNFKIFEIANEQRAMQLKANKLEKQISEANSKIESGTNLREKINQMSGLTGNINISSTSDEKPSKKNMASVDFPRIKKALDSYRKLRDTLVSNEEYTNSLPLLYPVRQRENITNKFGYIQDPFTRKELPHKGLDFAVREGDTVIATGDGIVESITKRNSGFGTVLEIQHTPNIKTVYAHLQSTLVQSGKHVKRGQPIALAGKSGSVLWPVLHYEVLFNGVNIDPENYFITP